LGGGAFGAAFGTAGELAEAAGHPLARAEKAFEKQSQAILLWLRHDPSAVRVN